MVVGLATWKQNQNENIVEFKKTTKNINQVSGLSGCEIKGFGMAYYSVPCGLITTVFSLTLSSLVSVPNLGEKKRHFLNYATIVKLDEPSRKTKKPHFFL